MMIDTHTADGLKVAGEHRTGTSAMVVLETAQAVKFTETIREALGREPIRPADFVGLEEKAQRVEVMAADAAAVRQYVARHCGP